MSPGFLKHPPYFILKNSDTLTGININNNVPQLLIQMLYIKLFSQLLNIFCKLESSYCLKRYLFYFQFNFISICLRASHKKQVNKYTHYKYGFIGSKVIKFKSHQDSLWVENLQNCLINTDNMTSLSPMAALALNAESAYLSFSNEKRRKNFDSCGKDLVCEEKQRLKREVDSSLEGWQCLKSST